MATRRTSARLSGGSDGPVEVEATVNGRSPSGRKRTVNGIEVAFGDQDRKRRKKEMKSQSLFKPSIIPLNHSSDTPPEDESPFDAIPPPPSERKIARRRSSMSKPSESSGPSRQSGYESDGLWLVKSLKADNNMDAASARRNAAPVEFLSFASSSRSRPIGPRPSSPPAGLRGDAPRSMLEVTHAPGDGGESSRKRLGSMGPPAGFVRKTRKSMRGIIAEFGNDAVVPIPDEETPMIRKNKELRDAQRRSSLNMRGSRASSSLGKGEITIPHSNVDPSLFYKHISTVIPEPIRTRHLIAWCAKRAGDAALDRKGKGREDTTPDGDHLVKEIIEDLVASLGKGEVDTNVYSQVPTPSSMAALKPHSRNVTNREIEAKEEEIVKRCKDEHNEWGRIAKKVNRKNAEESDELSRKRAADRDPDVHHAQNAWMRDLSDLADKIIRQGDGNSGDVAKFADVEFKVDTLSQSTHSAVQYSRQTQHFLDGIFSSLTSDLQRHHRPGSQQTDVKSDPSDPGVLLAATRPPTSTPTRDPIHMLRALALADSREPRPEAVDLAKSLEPVSHSGSSLGNGTTPRRPGPGMTPRRVSHGRRASQGQPTPKQTDGTAA